MPVTVHRLKSKLEIEFQYGGRPYSKTGSIFIWAMYWDISLKFGIQLDFYFLKQMPLLNPYPVVGFWLYGRHLEKSMWRHNFTADRPIAMKFGRQMQNGMPMTIHRSKSKPEIEFQYGGVDETQVRGYNTKFLLSPELVKLNFCHFIRVMNDGPYTLL